MRHVNIMTSSAIGIVDNGWKHLLNPDVNISFRIYIVLEITAQQEHGA